MLNEKWSPASIPFVCEDVALLPPIHTVLKFQGHQSLSYIVLVDKVTISRFYFNLTQALKSRGNKTQIRRVHSLFRS